MTSTALTGFAGLEATLAERRERVEAALREHVGGMSGPVSEAARDALYAPAKRLRPILSLLVADVFDAPHAAVLPAACSIEMVHTASLILDDLPAMDDASMRRGRPACHVVHGEAIAILAAFALINRAFEVLANGWAGAPDASVRARLTGHLARAIGFDGLIAGQAMDLKMTGRTVELRTLEFVHSRKTGALFTASAAIGAEGAQATAEERGVLVAYAKNLGLAFQIVDDLIDATANPAESGKDVGKDAAKTTFVSFAGVEGARQLAAELAETSEAAIAGLGPRAEPLRELARYVVIRRR